MGKASDPGREAATPWVEVRGREELRRRLERLAEADELDPSDHDFVLFFFRASDPVLYPLAATVLGRAAVRSAELGAWLRDYAASRGIPLAGGIRLTGDRSRRRVLLAAAAACASDPAGWRRLSDPERAGDRGGGLEPLPDEVPWGRPSDLAVYMRALALRLQHGEAPPAVRERAEEVLLRSLREPGALQDVSPALRWAELTRALERGEGLPAGRTPGDLAAEAAAGLERAFDAAAGEGIGRRLRLLRARDALLDAAPAPDGSPTPEDPRGVLAEGLALLGDPRRWWARAPGERARSAHLMLRAAEGAGFPAGELRGLLDAHELPPAGRARTRILLALAEREGVGPETLVDATLLHALEDEALLHRLVPSGPPGELGAAVADALEHRIRMGLATEPEFRAEELLARLEVRRPHPGFFQLLRAVVGDRTYARPEGGPVPLAEWIEALEAESRLLLGDRIEAIPAVPPLPGAAGEIRRGLREGLGALDGAGGPPAVVEDLVDLLDGSAKEAEGARAPDFRALLAALHGASATTPIRALEAGARAAREEARRMVPGELPDARAARGAVETLRRGLRDAVGDVAPLVPATEGRLLEAAAARVDGVLREWMGDLAATEAAWRAAAGSTEPEEARWSAVLEAVAAVPRASGREALLPAVWRTLAQGSGRDGSGRPGARAERLLRWAVERLDALPSEADRRAWLGVVARHWTELVDEGIRDGLETRVARLVREPGERTLALLPGIEGALERARVWFFDCYRVADAARVTRILNLRRDRGGVAALPRDLLGFFLHYSPVWLALLIGAILMLDFGDAWTSMAEVGDVRGIAVTFALGLVGAFAYVTAELGSRVRDAPGDRVGANRLRRVLRALAFVAACLAYSVVVVSLLWWLLSGTDEVVHGAGAVLHVIVWSGFSLFVGVFFGLLAKGS